MKYILSVLLLATITASAQDDVTTLKLKDYRPQSFYKIPITRITKAKYPVIDMHSHDYAKTDEDIDRWVRTMDSCGIEKSIILSGATGKRFDSIYDKYSRHKNRFLLQDLSLAIVWFWSSG